MVRPRAMKRAGAVRQLEQEDCSWTALLARCRAELGSVLGTIVLTWKAWQAHESPAQGELRPEAEVEADGNLPRV